jgi:GNAT superfamily N-acetyltransferase
VTVSPQCIRRLEDLAADAWPAAATERLHGWRLGFNRGVTRRANSVIPNRWDRPQGGLEAALLEVERRYRRRGLRPCFKLTSAAIPAGLDTILEARGYASQGWTDVHTANIDAVTAAGGDQVRLHSKPTPEWIATCWSERDRRTEVPVLTALVDRIATPRVFALVQRDGVAAAGGLAIRVGDWVGITAVLTLPGYRRTGAARAVVGALAGWARAQGASSLYVQIETDNQPARQLYPPLGFRPAYRYHYRAL